MKRWLTENSSVSRLLKSSDLTNLDYRSQILSKFPHLYCHQHSWQYNPSFKTSMKNLPDVLNGYDYLVYSEDKESGEKYRFYFNTGEMLGYSYYNKNRWSHNLNG